MNPTSVPSPLPPPVQIPPKVFARRRTRVLDRLAGDVMVLPAAETQKRSRDTERRYRPDSELYYLTGLHLPGIVAVLRDEDQDGFVLFVPPRNPEEELWSGPRPGLEELKERVGADGAYPIGELEDRLPPLLRQHRRIYFRLGVWSSVEPLVLQALRWTRARGARTGSGPGGVVDPGEILDPLRLVKDTHEIAVLRQAAEITAASFRETLAQVRPGMGEWELEALLESGFRRRGALGPAFPTIVGSGDRACTLHYVENDGVLGHDDLVLVDGGAEVGLYAGDVSRTFPASGEFSDAQRAVYSLVLRAHDSALARVKPGAAVSHVHDAAVETLLGGLIALGVLDGEEEELRARKAWKPFFPHQTSHWLGLDVHDVGEYADPSGSRVLEPGMVLTIEPGLYFPTAPPGTGSDGNGGEAGRRLGRAGPTPFQGMGVRIEDDVLVTPDGYDNLTSSLPVEPSALESLVGAEGPG